MYLQKRKEKCSVMVSDLRIQAYAGKMPEVVQPFFFLSLFVQIKSPLTCPFIEVPHTRLHCLTWCSEERGTGSKLFLFLGKSPL